MEAPETITAKEILSFESWCATPWPDHNGHIANVEDRHAALQAAYGDAAATLATYKIYHYHRYLHRCGIKDSEQPPYMRSAFATLAATSGPRVLWKVLHPRDLAEQTLHAWNAVVTLPRNSGMEIVITPLRPLAIGRSVRVSKSRHKSTTGKTLWLLELLA